MKVIRTFAFVASIIACGALLGAFGNRRTHAIDRSTTSANVHVRGRVAQAGNPVSRIRLSFNARGNKPVELLTDANGRFDVTLAKAGDYSVLVKPLAHVSSTDRFGTFSEGENTFNIELPPTSIHLVVSSKIQNALGAPVELLIRGPSSPATIDRAGVLMPSELPSLSLIGVGFGDYTILAMTPSGLTSVRPSKFSLSPENPAVTIELELTRRPLNVKVQDALGSVITNATILAYGRKIIGTNGVFDLERVADGEQLQVSAPGFLPTCKVVAASKNGQPQPVVLRTPDRQSVLVTLLGGPRRIIGILDGLPGSDCPVAVTGFRPAPSTSINEHEVSFRVDGLPPGQYVYRADALAPPMLIETPGSGIRYVVPERCKLCG